MNDNHRHDLKVVVTVEDSLQGKEAKILTEILEDDQNAVREYLVVEAAMHSTRWAWNPRIAGGIVEAEAAEEVVVVEEEEEEVVLVVVSEEVEDISRALLALT